MALWDTFYPPMDWEANRKSWPHTSHSRFVTVHGQVWHVQTFGHGPVLLLLHGTGASTHSWRDLVLSLAKHHTVICPDLPGHAFSYWNTKKSNSLDHMATSLADLLNHLKLWPSAIIGHSAGAAVGAQLILKHGKGPTPTLIGLNPAWLPLTGLASWLFPPTAKLLALNPLSGVLFAKQAAKPAVVRNLLQSTGSHLDEVALGYYQKLLQTPSHVRGVLAMMAAWRLHRLAQQLPQLTGPVFMLLGANDRTIPASLAAETMNLLPNTTSRTLAGLGHLAHEEAPAVVSEQILAWVKQTAR
ncbi:alpha/beta fold hydrolase BchO [Rhodoferax sp. U11-2br]|uniref:alpha/beta fold hydrolase BchO n=1 Tax=Rhodoferax sp. U11-2br TaxID=2838878 RepID=UPI001BE670F5|nr:alpha/beta fold hydrolase BchO [Rhodoferax sp. U11-2br]MBT3065815.1 alpha/beta fold hydrolase [Rhodoferax sp. U11-2br]